MRASRILFQLYAALPRRFFQRPLYKVYTRLRRLDRRRSVIKVIDGITYDLDLTQDIDSNIYYKGCHEPQTTAFISAQVKPGMGVLDIGANIGAHTLRLARLASPAGRVIAFEPMSWAFARLQRNASLNDCANLTLEKIGLADFTGTRRINIRSRWSLDRDKRDRNDSKDFDEEDIRFMRLDDYLAERPVERIDFIKLDVDGYDYKVVRGAEATLRQHHPLIIAELAPWYLKQYGDSAEGLLEALRALDYVFSLEEEPGRRLTSPAEVMTARPPSLSSNLICWPPGA